MKKIAVGVLGATGMVGQNYVSLLSDHPWFEVCFLAASEKSAGKKYGEVMRGKWLMDSELPKSLKSCEICSADDVKEAKNRCKLVFSALGDAAAEKYEKLYAKEGFVVISNTSMHRKCTDVPVIIPEINPNHLDILPWQQKRRGWDGFIVSKSNCSIQAYLIPLYAIHKEFNLQKIMVTTMQSVSGGGYSGVSSVEIVDNVIPFINREEEKSEWEPKKILGSIKDNEIVDYDDLQVTAHCNRVPVLHGHMACVSAQFEKKIKREDILDLWSKFNSLPQELDLPTAPKESIVYFEESNRPQPRLDRNVCNGMAVCVGRLRECPIFDWRFVGLSHNAIKGAAGGGVLTAELLVAKKYVG